MPASSNFDNPGASVPIQQLKMNAKGGGVSDPRNLIPRGRQKKIEIYLNASLTPRFRWHIESGESNISWSTSGRVVALLSNGRVPLWADPQQSFTVNLGLLGVCLVVASTWCVHAPPFRWHFKNGHALCTQYRDCDTFISPFSFRLQEPCYQSRSAPIPKNRNSM